jgi:hypothetical protein
MAGYPALSFLPNHGPVRHALWRRPIVPTPCDGFLASLPKDARPPQVVSSGLPLAVSPKDLRLGLGGGSSGTGGKVESARGIVVVVVMVQRRRCQDSARRILVCWRAVIVGVGFLWAHWAPDEALQNTDYMHMARGMAPSGSTELCAGVPVP